VTELSRHPNCESNAKRAGKGFRAVPRDSEGEDIMAHLLLIDDDPALIPQLVRQVFPGPEHRVEVAGTGAQGLERVTATPPDVILLDLRLPDQSGLDVYQQIRRIDARIPVIFVTMAKTADAAIEAMRQGAYDYLSKPLDPHRLRRVVDEALEVARRMRQPAVVAETAPDPDVDGAIVGTCPAMIEVYKAIGRVAAQDVPVLITGESGTGKELVALAVYQHGPRAKAPFLALNCAAIPENLLESELFGHEKGAFTGADRRRIGKFEQCNGGTIFLDEVGDMPLALQAKSGRGEVPPRPLLSPGRLHHPPATAAGAGRRPSHAGAALPAPLQPRARA
jgi:two-component system response regulator AtoC